MSATTTHRHRGASANSRQRSVKLLHLYSGSYIWPSGPASKRQLKTVLSVFGLRTASRLGPISWTNAVKARYSSGSNCVIYRNEYRVFEARKRLCGLGVQDRRSCVCSQALTLAQSE